MLGFAASGIAQEPISQKAELAFAVLPDDRWPGRLVVGGQALDDFVAVAEEPSPEASWTVRVFQSTTVPELQIRAQWRTIGAVTEWIPTLVNNSANPSGKITEVRSLAASWQTRGPVDFYGNKGSQAELDDFADRTELDIDTITLMPEGGRSSDGIFPFFALTDRHDALAIGIGWSGRWDATLRHASGNLEIEVGLPQVGFVLRPGETVRLPSILLAQAPGANPNQVRRLVRAHLANHVVPKHPTGNIHNFIAHGTMHQYHVTRVTNEQIEIEAMERAAALGFEAHWVDACWYGDEPDWAGQAGNWNVRRSAFPRGLRPISDRAHELGMKFIFWMEPERARLNTEWPRAHPDLFLSFAGDHPENGWTKDNLLLNLGDPRAVDLAFETISSLITEFNADIYRQDFNTTPLYAWYAADAPDRVGMTEIRYVEGLYALWDRIQAAHPGIMIDNCASGGRRIDLETLRRAVVLTRSDVVDVGNKAGPEGKVNIVNQTQCWGLGHWLADHAVLNATFDAYAVRGALCTGFMAYRVLPKDEHDPEYADAIAAVSEMKRIRSFMADERIGLIAPDLEKEAWTAYQHQTKWNDYRADPLVQLSGAALKELAMTIAQTRSSVLVEYQRVDG